MTYPLKFRQHVLAFKKKEALTYAETADRFGLDEYTFSTVPYLDHLPFLRIPRIYHSTLLSDHSEIVLNDDAVKHVSVGSASLMRWAKRLEPCLTSNKPATKINRAALILDV